MTSAIERTATDDRHNCCSDILLPLALAAKIQHYSGGFTKYDVELYFVILSRCVIVTLFVKIKFTPVRRLSHVSHQYEPLPVTA